MLLTSLPTGSVARVRAVSTESAAVLRLREMGVRPGTLIRLAGRAAAGSHIVMIGASRIAVDKATSALIDVDCA